MLLRLGQKSVLLFFLRGNTIRGGDKLNKKILSIPIVLIIMVLLVTPVLASPTKGQKVAVTLYWTRTSRVTIEEKFSDGVVHRLLHLTWDIELVFDGGPTYYGTAFTERYQHRWPERDGMKMLLRDKTVFSFPDQNGGFEGNDLVMLDNFINPPPGGRADWDKAKAHGLFMGTGAFEGQTLNVGHHWKPRAGPPVWEGYLLKP
jgi:hypothetical protein